MPEVEHTASGTNALARFLAGRFDSKEGYDLRLAAERLWLTRGFDRLLALDGLQLELYDHQRRAVLRVLRDLRGRALLADEVGLGKTIEAGVILREYWIRGLVRRALLLVPAGLVDQWWDELCGKLKLGVHRARGVSHWEAYDLVVGSLDLAKRPEHAARITRLAWDMVVVDEAHRLRSRSSVAWQFVNAIRKKYVLLLTATPVQNDLIELYNLVTLLRPGQLLSFGAFRREFMADRRSPRNVERLRELLAEVTVRTARREANVRLPRREVHSLAVPMAELEAAFYAALVGLLRTSYARTPKADRNLLPYILLLRLATSHPAGAVRTLQAMVRRGTLPRPEQRCLAEVVGLAQHVTPSKFSAVAEILERHQEPAVVFTAFKETLRRLAVSLAASGHGVIAFHAGLGEGERSAALRQFREEERGVLVSTEAGGEGLNLQFCRNVINYDLPWNPLRLEQRIGRVHRLGQTHPVRVYNLATAGTVEGYILYLLEKKIAMFNKVIGELEAILSDVPGGFAARLAEAALEADSPDALQRRVDAFGAELEAAARRFERRTRLARALFEGDPVTERQVVRP